MNVDDREAARSHAVAMVKVLVAVMKDKKAGASARVRAAWAVLKYAPLIAIVTEDAALKNLAAQCEAAMPHEGGGPQRKAQ